MKRPPTFRPWADATEPNATSVDRLRQRLAGPDVTLLLSELASVDDRAVGRLRGRLRPPRRGAPLWVKLAIPVAVVVTLSLMLRGVPRGELHEELAAQQRTERALTPAVGLVFRGSGSATGSYASPRLHWDVGVLGVEVDPDAGVDLVVDTSEATIRVVGTGFTVKRDARGTTVDVLHGAVAVSCGDGWTGRLGAAEGHVCLPMTPSGWLMRVQALRDEGTSPEVLLDAIARGLALAPPSDPVAAELLEVRIEVLLGVGRIAEAREAARAYPADGPRAADLADLLDPARGARP